MRTAFFTIASWNYLHYSRALASSLAEHHPEIPRILAIADTRRSDLESGDFPEFDASVFFDDLDLPNPRAFSFRYDVLELNTAIKPTVFLRLFAQGYDRVIYLDPDIVAYRRFDEMISILDAGASAVLTPHSLEPNLQPDSPNDLTFMQAGVYNLGFLALAKTPETLSLLKWWETRLRTECVSTRLKDGIFVDQKFVDLWPAYCSGTHILRDPSYNVGYWNLDSRRIEQGAGTYEVNGVPLAFFHFSGVVPGDRTVLSKHQNRWRPNSSESLQNLFNDYHDRLERYGARRFASIPYGFQFFANGTDVPHIARIFFREHLEPFDGDPFVDLPAYLNEPSDLHLNPRGLITRLSLALWTTRADLQSHFDLRSAASQLRYADWYISGGAAAAGISGEFVRPLEQKLPALRADIANASTLVSGVARAGYRLLMKAQPRIRRLYQPIPPAMRKRFLDGLLRRAWPATSEAGPVPSLQPGVSLIGYPFAEMGVGEAMRSLARAIESVGIDYEVVNFGAQVRSSQKDRTLAARLSDTPTRKVNVFCVNADMLTSTIHGVGTAAVGDRYNIIRPFWELPRINPSWIEGLKQIDEIWAPTTFVRDAFQAGCERTVTHIPVSISLPDNIRPDRRRFRIPEASTAFLFAFDFSSYPTRKNPGAVLQAYRRAFGEDRSRQVSLVIKTMGESPRKTEFLNTIRSLARDDRRIVLIDEVLTRYEMYALTASCDSFVSLHRSEGFGLGIAEAMAMGKAVLATDFSGSKDFVSKETGFPIPFTLVSVKEEEYPYFVEGQKWAEPDIDEAARSMQLIADDPRSAAKIGDAAKSYIGTFHSPEAVGKIVEARLQQICGNQNTTLSRCI